MLVIPQRFGGLVIPRSRGVKLPAYINQTDQALDPAISTTFSHTTTSDTSLLVVIAHGYDGGSGGAPAVSSVTFDGQSLTQAASATAANSSHDVTSAIWYLASPPQKTANLALSWNINVLGYVQAINVANASALDVTGTDVTPSPLSVGITTTAATIMFGAGMAIQAPAPTLTWSSGVVEIADRIASSQAAGPNVRFGAGYRQSTAAESYSFQMTPSTAVLAGNLAVAAFK